MDTISANNPSHLIVTEAEFRRWLTRAEPGYIFQYHDGCLVLDVTKGSTRLSTTERKELVTVARLAWAASEYQMVHLVQRRLGPNRFSYLAIARVWPTNGEAALPAILTQTATSLASCASHDANGVGPWGTG